MKRDNFQIPGIQVPPHQPNLYDRILTPQALGFVAHLHRKYEALKEAGKPSKVAITAIMRKLIVLANALVRDNRTWSAKTT